jgi:AcrR family transcriptional regulator
MSPSLHGSSPEPVRPRAGRGSATVGSRPATRPAGLATLPRGVHTPSQRRGRESLERLLAAAERLVDQRGLDAVTVGDVVREARSSVGVFYARFADKDALLRCLHERFCARGREWAETAFAPERWESAGAAEVVRTLIDGLGRMDAKRAGLVRAFVLASGRDPSYAERAAAVGRELSAHVRRLLLARRGELRVDDSDRAIDFAVWLVIAHHDQRAVFGAVRTSELAWSADARRDALARTVLAQLGIAAGPAHARSAARPRSRARDRSAVRSLPPGRKGKR